MLGVDESVLELQEQLPSIQNISLNDEDVNVKARATSPDGRFLKFEEEIGKFVFVEIFIVYYFSSYDYVFQLRQLTVETRQFLHQMNKSGASA